MKVLHVVRQFHPSVGGMESVVAALCNRLRQRGHDCEVVTLRRLWNDRAVLPPRDVVDGVRVERIPFAGGRRYFFAPDVLRLAAGHSLIHVHGIDFFIDFLAATKWHHRTPLVTSTHGGIFHTSWAMAAKRVYFHTITRLALSQADRVICDSAQDDRLFAPIVPARKRVTISNGVEDAFFQTRKSIEPGLLVMVGRIAEHKGIDRVISLLPRIRRQIPEARLVVVGPDWEGLRGSLEAQAQAAGVSDSVSFAGAVDRASLLAHLARAHLVLAPSAFEGFGIAVIEAMASGNLVIGSDIEAHRELIVPDVNGLLVDFADDECAVRSVVGALRLPAAQVAARGQQARATVSRFAWDRVTDQVERAYREAVSSKWKGHALSANARGVREADAPGPSCVRIGGLPFDNLDMPQTVAAVAHALARGLRGYIVTPNVDHLVLYHESDAFRAACAGAWLRLADGMPIVWASRLLGRPLKARVAGSDLFPALCAMAARDGYPVFFLGGAPGAAERAATRLAARFPGLRFAGAYTPPDCFEPEGEAADAAVRAVNSVRPALLFVALGTPKQELWVHRHWSRLDATFVLCCGAAFDFIAGIQVRAPGWLQRVGLEWLWRLAHDPVRLWRRYLVRDAAFVGIFLKEWRNARNRVFGKR